MAGDGEPRDTPDPESSSDGSRETSFLREVAFSPEIEPPGAPRVQPGDTVGRFRIERLLGRGGMGTVYAAQDLTLERRVALKLLTRQVARDDSQGARMLREARATARVSHPNLATLFDIGRANGLVFIAMELVEGRTLRAALDASPAPLPDAFRIASEMARGLSAVHGASLVHRDIKPENVMIAASGAVKLLDFGLATLSQAEETCTSLESRDGAALAPRWIGTPAYMSPEQARGVTADARSDVFSFGIVLYEMLTGERPFRGATAGDVLLSIAGDAPRPMPRLPAAGLAHLAGIVDRCLQKDPRDRYADASELSSALEATTAGTPAAHPRRRWALVAAGAAIAAVGALAWPRDRALPAPRAAAIPVYASALQSLHDSNWGQAELSLREALRLDPTLGIAHLRLAIILSYLDYTAAEAKASYREAMRLRGSLSPRDHDLLMALEPLLNADPTDLKETVRGLARLTERYPHDAELFHLLGIYSRWDGPEGQLAAARRALSIDPDYPDAWAAVAEASAGRDPAASIDALDHCLRIAPTASDCRMLRATLEGALGRCEQAEQHIRRATDDPHASESMFLLRGTFLYALGEPREAVDDAFRQRWARLPPGTVSEDALYDSAVVAAAYGDFDLAIRKAEEGLRRIDPDATLRPHARFVLLHTDVEIEAGDVTAAAATASSFLNRRSAWQRGLPTDDPTVYLTRVVARASGLAPGEMQARRDAWYRSAMASVTDERTLARSVWRLAYVQGIETAEEAKDALDARPDGDEPLLDDALDAAVGRALWLSGQADEALPYLARAHQRCDRLGSIVSAVRADLLYGEALEKRGDRATACKAYGSILARWGNARPRSVTADAARRRSAALRCGERDD